MPIFSLTGRGRDAALHRINELKRIVNRTQRELETFRGHGSHYPLEIHFEQKRALQELGDLRDRRAVKFLVKTARHLALNTDEALFSLIKISHPDAIEHLAREIKKTDNPSFGAAIRMVWKNSRRNFPNHRAVKAIDLVFPYLPKRRDGVNIHPGRHLLAAKAIQLALKKPHKFSDAWEATRTMRELGEKYGQKQKIVAVPPEED